MFFIILVSTSSFFLSYLDQKAFLDPFKLPNLNS